MSLLSVVRSRHPAVAIAFSLFFGIPMSMAYIGRGWWSLFYCLISLVVGLAGFLVWSQTDWAFETAFLVALLPFAIVGLIHTSVLAYRIPPDFRFRWFSRWLGLILVFVALPEAATFVIRTFIVQPFTIPAGSMIPTVELGNYLVASKSAYGYSQFSTPFGEYLPAFDVLKVLPKRGDVVLFALPRDLSTPYIKRVIGLAGDRVQMRGGMTFLNGKPLPRKPISAYSDKSGRYMNVPRYVETLPEGKSYTIIELTDEAESDNTQEFIVPPGHCFVMGDNRDNSSDSRFTLSYVPYANIFAKALFVLDRENPSNLIEKIE